MASDDNTCLSLSSDSSGDGPVTSTPIDNAPAPVKWTLRRSPVDRAARGGSSRSQNQDSSSEEEELFLYINGARAKSVKSGAYYTRLRGFKTNGNFAEMTVDGGKKIRMVLDDLDLTALTQELNLDDSFSLDILQDTISSHINVGTRTKRRPSKNVATRRKRQKTTSFVSQPADGTCNSKIKGVVEIALAQVQRAPQSHTLVDSHPEQVERFKATLRDSENHRYIPILPVMTMNEDWNPTDEDDHTFYLLGGCSLWEAMLDLSTDDRYSQLRKCLVRVHCKMTPAEALEVGMKFQQEQVLLQDNVPTFQRKVEVCRALLYSIHDLDIDVDEPPRKVKEEWRIKAAAALGCPGSNAKERKRLENTFQAALFSRRCYSKAQRLFSIFEEKHGKALKQSVFLYLQGLTDDDRFSLLTKLVNGELKVDEVKGVASKLKGVKVLQREFSSLARMSWEDCCEQFPIHTTEAALQPFLGLDFKRGIPREFVDFVEDARSASDENNNASTYDRLRLQPVKLAIVEVESNTTDVKTTTKQLADGAIHVAVIAKRINDAAKWAQHLTKAGFEPISETVVLSDSSAKHLLIFSMADNTEAPPALIEDEDMSVTLLNMYTAKGDKIANGLTNQDPLEQLARELQRKTLKVLGYNY